MIPGAAVPAEGGEVPERPRHAPHPKKRKGKSTRWNIPAPALGMLEQVFLADKFPTVDTRKALAADLKVTPRQVQVWFQNKRQRSTKPPVKRVLTTSEDIKAALINLTDNASVDPTLPQLEVFANDDPLAKMSPGLPGASPEVWMAAAHMAANIHASVAVAARGAQAAAAQGADSSSGGGARLTGAFGNMWAQGTQWAGMLPPLGVTAPPHLMTNPPPNLAQLLALAQGASPPIFVPGLLSGGSHPITSSSAACGLPCTQAAVAAGADALDCRNEQLNEVHKTTGTLGNTEVTSGADVASACAMSSSEHATVQGEAEWETEVATPAAAASATDLHAGVASEKAGTEHDVVSPSKMQASALQSAPEDECPTTTVSTGCPGSGGGTGTGAGAGTFGSHFTSCAQAQPLATCFPALASPPQFAAVQASDVLSEGARILLAQHWQQMMVMQQQVRQGWSHQALQQQEDEATWQPPPSQSTQVHVQQMPPSPSSPRLMQRPNEKPKRRCRPSKGGTACVGEAAVALDVTTQASGLASRELLEELSAGVTVGPAPPANGDVPPQNDELMDQLIESLFHDELSGIQQPHRPDVSTLMARDSCVKPTCSLVAQGATSQGSTHEFKPAGECSITSRLSSDDILQLDEALLLDM